MAAVSAAASANSHIFCKDIHGRDQQQQVAVWLSSSSAFCGDVYWKGEKKKIKGQEWKVKAAFWQDISRPGTVEMEPITSVDQLEQILANAQQISQPIIIEWMASWCRKCIYLKPKLEKLAAEYNSKLKFYCVDVNNVSQALVKRGNISKMPTIQLWKDGEMKEEIIGGHKAWIVIDEVREMIQKYV